MKKKTQLILISIILIITSCSTIRQSKQDFSTNTLTFTCPTFGTSITKVAQHCSMVTDSANAKKLFVDDLPIFQDNIIAGSGISVTGSYPNFTITSTASFSPSINNSPGRSIVTGTGATGFQVSSTKVSDVQYSPTMITTATIAGAVSDVIVFEIASTNSSTPSDWIEIGRVTNGQSLTLALTLQSVQTTSGVLSGYIPAGFFAKIRAITSGTVSNSMTSGQEVIFN